MELKGRGAAWIGKKCIKGWKRQVAIAAEIVPSGSTGKSSTGKQRTDDINLTEAQADPAC
ncbi:MAG: hypothetical protein ACP5O2_06365 [Bacteroidales bacterium]